MAESWRVVRLLAAAEAEGGSHAVGRLYDAVGTTVHDQGRELDDTNVAEALAEAGLPRQLESSATTGHTTRRSATATPAARNESAPSRAVRSSRSTTVLASSVRS
jgi:hypothetical protein